MIRVQNIGENLRERASASWATSIFRRASERELDDFRFLASERASSLTRSQARSHLTLALDGKLDRARELTLALERSKIFFSTMQL